MVVNWFIEIDLVLGEFCIVLYSVEGVIIGEL